MKKSLSQLLSYVLLRTVALLLTTVLLVSAHLSAQGTSATVTGAVTDASGATLPGATVSYTNLATGVKANATTNESGIYRMAGLLPGLYSGTVTMQGFKTAVRQGINLQVEDQVKLDFSLEIGAITDSVTVETGSALLETQSPTVSQVIEGRQVEDTPLNGRNAMNLIALTPGVVPQGSTTGSLTGNANGGSSTNAQAFGNYAIAGGLANQGSVYVDGAPVNSVEAHVTSLIPAQDSVQEFRVETSVVNPQYGEFSGGVVSFVTKSGGNALHGTAYDYLRNTIFNANNFFLSGINQPRPKQIQNQFGATVGGPVMKDKAFFYASYEGLRSALGVPNLGRVPTAAELVGDFRADPKVINPVPVLVNNPGTAPIAQYNQASCHGVLNTFCLPGQATQAGDALIDPTAYYMANTLHYFPLPNTTNAGPAYNFSQTGKASSYLNTFDGRLDYALGSKQKLFAKYARLYGTQLGTQFVFNNPTAPSSGTSFGTSTTQVVLGDTIVPNATSVIDVRLSYLRFNNSSVPSATNLAGYGPFYAGIANQVDYPSFPTVVLSNSAPQPFVQLSFFTHQPTNHYVISGTYSKLLGRHSLSFGGEARRREEYPVLNPATTGLYIFAGTSTSCIPSGAPTQISYSSSQHFVSGISCGPVGGPPTNLVIPGTGATPISDFISGQFTVAPLGLQTSATPSAINRYGGLFVNDSFQLSSKLTLTAGLRYELPGGFVEKHNNNAVLLPQLANPLVLVNSSAYSSRSDLQTHLKLFSPRLGFAYQPYPATTVRAGYSLAYLPMDIVYTSGPSGSSVESPTTFVPAGNLLSAPLGYLGNTTTPVTTLLRPIGRAYAANSTYFYGQTISGRNPDSPFPYLQQWNANVQHSFGSNGTIMQLAYLGARGQHLPIAITYNINQLPDNATLSQANRPYAQYQNVNENSAWIGDTYYNSLQATLTKRFKGGGTILGNYSWSKLLGTADSTNPFAETHAGGVIQDYSNTRGERSYTSFDVPQRLVISYILDLPIGHGKRFLGNADGVVDTLVGGWNASGINTFQSGFPLALTTLNNIVGEAFGGGTIRPNVAAGCDKKVNIGYVAAAQQQKSVINPACFSMPGPAAGAVPVAKNFFGNEARTDGQIRTQGVDNWDFSVGKTTPLHESVNLVFRAEAFNVTNRVQFGDPGLSFGSGTFGLLTTQANPPRSFQFSLRVNY